MELQLFDHQLEAIKKLKSGSILCGGVGTGKSRTALGYFYFYQCQGSCKVNGVGIDRPFKICKDLYIITTAKVRDSGQWEKECDIFDLKNSGIKVTIDSWHNIKKYIEVLSAFFIFDEQRLVNRGEWSRSFLRISKNNDWILLSATPGDTWMDYAIVFIANKFYRNITDFRFKHVVYSQYGGFRKIDHYIGENHLENLRDRITVIMKTQKDTLTHWESIFCDYDKVKYEEMMKTRWDPFKNEPIKDAGEVCRVARQIVNSDVSRIQVIEGLFMDHPKMIIFYNFNYEIEALRQMATKCNIKFAEWNGFKHEDIPQSESWLYFVQYSAGAEGWNCISTNVVVYFSQTYSYKTFRQCAGRIDRMNTPYVDLYYYILLSRSSIDMAIQKALKEKRNFNIKIFEKVTSQE